MKSDLIASRIAYLKRQFFSSEGIFDYSVGSAVFGYIVITFSNNVLETIRDLIRSAGITNFTALQLISYALFGIVLTILGLAISVAVTYAYITFIKPLLPKELTRQ